MYQRFAIQETRRLAKAAGFLSDDLAVFARPTKAGRTTFALAVDYGQRQFPEFVVSDVPLRDIRSWCRVAIRGARIFRRRRGRAVNMWQSYWLGSATVGGDELQDLKWDALYEYIHRRTENGHIRLFIWGRLETLREEGLSPYQALVEYRRRWGI